MIVFDLECRAAAHRFEGWFSSGDDYAKQLAEGLLVCPVCSSSDVGKAVMAPNVGRKGNQLPAVPARVGAEGSSGTASPPALSNAAPPLPLPPEAAALFRAIATAQAEALKSSRWVGGKFADQARAMHYGERDHELIHGQASSEEVRDLVEEGVEIAPLLIPVVPPDQAN